MLAIKHLTYKSYKISRLFLPISLCLSLSFSPTITANDLPNLGSSDLIEYTKDKEQALGRAFKTALHNEYTVIDDPDISNFVRRIGHQISQHTGDDRNFSFFVIQNPDINAFAGPDGVIGIHTGLIRAVENEAELASVLAHEIAHVTQNHLSRRFELQSSSSIGDIASIIAAILIGMHDSSAGMATLMGTMGASAQQQLKYSRLHESEADSTGISYLYKSGYSPFAMGGFFARLSLEYQNSEFKPIEILQTHPVTEHRLAEAKNRAQNYPPLIFKHDNETLTLIKLRLENLTGLDDETVNANELDRHEQCYSNTIKLLKKTPATFNQNQLSCLNNAIKERPSQRLYQTLLYDVYLNPDMEKVPSEIIKQAELSHELYIQDPSVLLRYAQLLIKAGQTTKAQEVLKKETPDHRYQYQLYKLLSNSYGQKGKLAEAYFYEALSYFNIGDIKRTHIFIDKAKSLEKTGDSGLASQILRFETYNANLLKENNKDK